MESSNKKIILYLRLVDLSRVVAGSVMQANKINRPFSQLSVYHDPQGTHSITCNKELARRHRIEVIVFLRMNCG